MQSLLISALSLAGVLVGAMLQYAFGRNLEAKKQLSAQRAQAYIDYFRAIADTAQRPLKDQPFLVADAKARICLYGSSEVVKSLATFERAGADLGTREARAVLLITINAMRKDLLGDSKTLEEKDVKSVLFGEVAVEPEGNSLGTTA